MKKKEKERGSQELRVLPLPPVGQASRLSIGIKTLYSIEY